MKKKILFVMMCLLLSGCYLVPLETATPVSSATETKAQPVESATAEPNETATLARTPTLKATAAKTSTPAKTATAINTPTSTYTNTPAPYVLQADSPVYIQNFAHTDAACDWLGVAGQVFGEDGSPQLNLVLVVKGSLGQTSIDMTGVTGIPEADIYGPGGYEIVLADAPAQTAESLSIQVFDLQGTALSEPVVFNTYDDCDKNLIVINFLAQ